VPTYSIRELAQEFAVTPRAIRFYEDQGLLAPKRVGTGTGQRVYSQRDRTRLKLTIRGKRLGLTLVQICELVDMYESPTDTSAQLSKFLGVLAQHKTVLAQQLDDIQTTLAEISAHEQQCLALLAKQPTARSLEPLLTLT
jgi:DNA-binding transcriptional MerR regulator